MKSKARKIYKKEWFKGDDYSDLRIYLFKLINRVGIKHGIITEEQRVKYFKNWLYQTIDTTIRWTEDSIIVTTSNGKRNFIWNSKLIYNYRKGFILS